jgi:Mrp family chromosome partitioning ATPase
MKETMATLTATYDLVIYDTPALHGAVDANFLAAQTDGLVMVVSVRQTSRAKTSQVLKQLDEFHVPLLGVIVNRTTTKQHSHLEGSEDEDDVWESASAPVDKYNSGEYNGDGYSGDEYPQAPIPTPAFAEDMAS